MLLLDNVSPAVIDDGLPECTVRFCCRVDFCWKSLNTNPTAGAFAVAKARSLKLFRSGYAIASVFTQIKHLKIRPDACILSGMRL